MLVNQVTFEHKEQTTSAIKVHASSVLVQSAKDILKSGVLTAQSKSILTYSISFCVCTGQMA